MPSWFYDLFISEAKPALSRHSGGSSDAGNGSIVDCIVDGSLTELNSNATSVHEYRFRYSQYLKKVIMPNVETLGQHAFNSCGVLETVSMPKLKTIGKEAFMYCHGLKKVDFPKLERMESNGLANCNSLEEVNIPLATTVTVSNCKSLVNIVLPSVKTVYGSFNSCYALKKVDLHSVTSIGGYAFSNCRYLDTLIIRNTNQVCTLSGSTDLNGCYKMLGTVNSTYNPNGEKGCIYVPAALVDGYKAATNWSAFADQFRALEDYTVDGTITGELDESKI